METKHLKYESDQDRTGKKKQSKWSSKTDKSEAGSRISVDRTKQ